MLHTLLKTKLHLPAAQPNIIARPHLVSRLNAGLQGKLTLIAAPPGSGKTVLFSEWRSAYPEKSLVWVSLDSDDNNFMLFSRYLAAALEPLFPGLASEIRALTELPQLASLKPVVTTLINGLAGSGTDLVIVLDDYHVINNGEIHEAVDLLLDRLPTNVHVALIARSDPPLSLSRLRVRQQLMEIRADDLRFRLDEVGHLFRQFGHETLSEMQLKVLESRTEGWIAGLQLAALSMRDVQDIDAFLESFKGTHRFVMDYLLEEVLNHQSETLQMFLLSTSILSRMTASLCDALLPNNHTQAILDELVRTNFFVIRLDNDGYWYRYHHLFADLLQHRLKLRFANQIEQLHQAASIWFEQNGYLGEAIQHAIAAADWERAAQLMEREADSFWLQGGLQIMAASIDQFPADFLAQRPGLNLIRALTALRAARIPEADSAVTAAEAHSALHPHWQARTMTLRSFILRIRGDNLEANRLSQQAIAMLAHDDLIWRTLAFLNLQEVARFEGDVDRALDFGKNVIALSGQSQDLLTLLNGYATQAELYLEQGSLHEAQRQVDAIWEILVSHGLQHSPLAGFYDIARGLVAYESNALEAAQQAFTQAFAWGEMSEIGDLVVHGAQRLVQTCLALGDVAGARAAFYTIAQLSRQVDKGFLAETLRACELRIWLAEGNLQSADAWAEGYRRDYETNAESFTFLTKTAPFAVVQWAIHRGALNIAETWLAKLREPILSGHQTAVRIKFHTLNACLHHRQGNTAQAFAEIEQAFSLAETQGYVRTIIDEATYLRPLLIDYTAQRERRRHTYASTILTALALPETAAPSTRSNPDALNERELEILRLLARGLTNQEIASQLFLSVNTVKWYIKTIFSKLDVSNRTQALHRAQERHLLTH